MDYILLEQYLTELVPTDVKPMVRALIECMKENPWMQFMMGVNALYPSFTHETQDVRNAAVTGLISGLCLAQSFTVQKFIVESNLKGFLDHRSKLRGENILDFLTERAKRQ